MKSEIFATSESKVNTDCAATDVGLDGSENINYFSVSIGGMLLYRN